MEVFPVCFQEKGSPPCDVCYRLWPWPAWPSLSGIPRFARKIRPAKIKVLIITGDDVDVHHWKETTPAIRKILVDSGKFDVQVSEDLKPLESADTLKAYDVVVLNRFNRKAPLSDAAKKNLLDFVRGGKGFFVAALGQRVVPQVGRVRQAVRAVLGDGQVGPRAARQSLRPRLPTRIIRSPPV